MNDSLKEALQLARKMEIDGMDFYGKAAENSGNTSAKSFFNSLALDEKRHLAVIEKVAAGVGVDVAEMSSPADSIRTVFSRLDEDAVSGELAATAGEKEAIEVALGMEKESYDLYAKAAENAGSEAQKNLFLRLQQEENQHYEMLKNTEEYLNDNDKWFLNTEGALLTGDMSSLG